MTRVLKLYNTFTRTLNNVELSGKSIVCNANTIKPLYGSFYICGPTVYSDCHLGHALTYVRADLLRRFLKSIFNVRLNTVMNVTDIDDKILAKTNIDHGPITSDLSEPSKHPFNSISNKYFKSFLNDMELIRVSPADLYVRVSRHMNLITSFIRRLECDKHAYIASTGDLHFMVSSIKNYVGRSDSRKENLSKEDARDFVLWKAAKPGEPIWIYQSAATGETIPGRPGWHVQCSAISSALFGDSLDFHFGGKDLIFPHHYNEEACCCAYHHLDTSVSMHTWVKNWLHSGHLILRNTKMSKSLGNVLSIKTFIDMFSVNAIRLLCVYFHYRSDIEFNEGLMEKIKSLDHKINAFGSFLLDELENIQSRINETESVDGEVDQAISDAYDNIIEGVCDDFHLDRGLESILNLSKYIYSKSGSLKPQSVISCLTLLKDWTEICGLEYGYTHTTSSQEKNLLNLTSEFRQKVRSLTLDGLKMRQNAPDVTFDELLKECDKVRAKMDEFGFVLRDPKMKI